MQASAHKLVGTISNDSGFLAIDALIGLLVVALGLIAAIEAESHVRLLSRSALDLRLATTEATFRLSAEWPKLGRPGTLSGANENGGHWLVTAWPERTLPHFERQLCGVRADVTIKGSAHKTTITTQRICLPGTGQ